MRCLPYLFVIGAVLFCGIAAAKTPDGETPAEESVCDDLTRATPGLYGLCVAFCEAQDCELTINATTGEVIEYGPNCRPSSLKLLGVYNRRRSIDDPTMPCVIEVGCPCWSESDIDLPFFANNPVCTSEGLDIALFTPLGMRTEGAFVRHWRTNCPDLKVGDKDWEPCVEEDVWECSYGRVFPYHDWRAIIPQEFQICSESIVNECSSRGLWPPSE
jgi:hypothetical protein